MKGRKFKSYSIAALFIIAVTLGLSTWNNAGNNALTWDAFGFYYYLKLVFIDQTLVLENLNSANLIFEKYKPSPGLYQLTELTNGRYIVRYPAGQSILYLPFFIFAHIAALLSDFPADGFSRPYDLMIRIGSLVYHFLGFYFVGRVLCLYYSDNVVGVTLVVLFFGTNAYGLFAGTAMVAQGSLFFLVALFIWLVDCYFKQKTTGLIIAVAAVFGLICLNRPTDFVTIAPAILWPLAIPGLSLKAELKHFFLRWNHVAIFVAVVAFCGFIQFGYWKYAGGSWFIDSYGSPQEGLDFLRPHTIPFLFSFRSGWFVYTPIMFLVMIYLFIRAFKGDGKMKVVLVYVILFVYLASSWTNWWYGNGFSQRAMVQAYALLCIPLAGLIDYAFFKRRKLHLPLAILIFALTVLSVWQTRQFHKGVFNGQTVTAEYYFASFFDLYPDPEKRKLLSINRFDYHHSGENYKLPDGYVLKETMGIEMGENENMEGREYFPGYKIPYHEFCERDHCFVLLSAVFEGPPPKGARLVTTFDHEGSYGYFARYALENMVDTNETANLYTSTAVYLTPNLRSENDKLHAYLWNENKQPGILKRLKLEVFEKSRNE